MSVAREVPALTETASPEVASASTQALTTLVTRNQLIQTLFTTPLVHGNITSLPDYDGNQYDEYGDTDYYNNNNNNKNINYDDSNYGSEDTYNYDNYNYEGPDYNTQNGVTDKKIDDSKGKVTHERNSPFVTPAKVASNIKPPRAKNQGPSHPPTDSKPDTNESDFHSFMRCDLSNLLPIPNASIISNISSLRVDWNFQVLRYFWQCFFSALTITRFCNLHK